MNIILVGYRGAGKTTLGRELAAELGYRFIDTDDEVVRANGITIPEIFAEYGEPRFREMESSALANVTSGDGAVISTGGGIILSEGNRRIIMERGFRAYLTASPEVIFQRIHRDTNRPSLTGKDPMDEIKELLNKRRAFYEEVAEVVIDTGKTPLAECVRMIRNKVGL
ncbi:MAG: shikimate kinase [Brevinematales bacterium]|nr:shikimate kinase [Brevinematales bacterium]